MANKLSLAARWVLDSRGTPTVEVDAKTPKGWGRASVPSGASTSSFEAIELRDGGAKFGGKGVTKAVSNVNKIIAKQASSRDFASQADFDRFLISLDGTKNKSGLGANAVLACSLAYCRAKASEHDLPLYSYLSKKKGHILPVPFCNVINGGKHAGNSLEFQEYMIVPNGAKSFQQAVELACLTYENLKEILLVKFGKGATNVGDEGGFAPPLSDVEEPLKLLEQAARQAGTYDKISFALDIAASSFYIDGSYKVKSMKNGYFDLLNGLAKSYKIISIEDPFHETDFDSFALFTKAHPKLQVIGDDLLSTNVERITKAIRHKSCNCLLLKVNQIGTLTEAIEASSTAYGSGWGVMVSHRSGETEDPFIADLSVALNCGQIKLGAPCRGERTAKYNQLLRIEAQLGKRAKFAGKEFHRPAKTLGV